MVQIGIMVAPSCLLHERLWELTGASVAPTSQALLENSINTAKYFKLARRTTLSTNGCCVQANILTQFRPRGFRIQLLIICSSRISRERVAVVCFEALSLRRSTNI